MQGWDHRQVSSRICANRRQMGFPGSTINKGYRCARTHSRLHRPALRAGSNCSSRRVAFRIARGALERKRQGDPVAAVPANRNTLTQAVRHAIYKPSSAGRQCTRELFRARPETHRLGSPPGFKPVVIQLRQVITKLTEHHVGVCLAGAGLRHPRCQP